uniref:ABC transporter domain-containing protein n=1 Tax=Cuerna arida TaxID=1464854 RepID=A0A1B6FD35_9HEMI
MLWNHMKLLVWKSLMYRMNYKVMTFVEIVFPVVFCLLLQYLRYSLGTTSSYYIVKPGWSNHYVTEKIYYSPKTNFTNLLMSKINNEFSHQYEETEIETESEFENFTLSHPFDDPLFVKFNENIGPDSTNYTYEIKSPRFSIDGTKYFSLNTPDYKNQQHLKSFRTVKQLIDGALIKTLWEIDGAQTPDLGFKRFQMKSTPMPFPKTYETYRKTNFMNINLLTFPFFIALMTIGVPLSTALYISKEKHSGFLGLSKLMGLKMSQFFTGCVFNVVPVHVAVTAITVFALKADFWVHKGPILQYLPVSNIVLALVIFLYMLSNIALFMLITILIRNPKISNIICITTPFVTFARDINISNPYYIILWFLPTTHLKMAFLIINAHASLGFPVNFSNINSVIFTESDRITSISGVLCSLVSVSVIYFICVYYVSCVYPGKIGVAKKWHFFITDSWAWLKECFGNLCSASDGRHIKGGEGIVVENLTRRFSGVEVVKGVSTSFHRSMISVLLGHNGAGKTTLFRMITGQLKPTSGQIRIDGYSVGGDSDLDRKMIGVCPQDNLLCSYLTVWQHLFYFAVLKGLEVKEAESEISQLLQMLNLENKSDTKPGELSGGMKRRLCLGNAIIGGSRVLLLDEMTSGLDPQTRREVWDILQKLRKDRTIVVTSHNMEEADAIGDWVVIMSEGEIKEQGNPSELKMKFNSGYWLSVQAPKTSHNAILRSVRKIISDAEIISAQQNSVSIRIPTLETRNFAQIFRKLETSKGLGVKSLGLKISTLDDVFLKTYAQSAGSELEDSFLSNYEKITPENRNSSMRIWSRISAIIYKKVVYEYHNWVTFLFTVLIFMCSTYELVSSLSTLGVQKKSYEPLTRQKIDLSLNLYPAIDRILVSYDPKSKDDRIANFVAKLNQSSGFLLEYYEGNLTEYMIRDDFEGYNEFMERNLIAYEVMSKSRISPLSIVCHVNEFALYSALLSDDLVDNVLINLNGSSAYDTYRKSGAVIKTLITFNVHESGHNLSAFIYAVFYLFTFTQILMNSLILLVTENKDLKGLQFTFGVNPLEYWVANYMFDYSLLTALTSISAIYIGLNDPVGILSLQKLHIYEIWADLLQFGASGLLFIYVASCFFHNYIKAVLFVDFAIIIFVIVGLVICVGNWSKLMYLNWFIFIRYGAYFLEFPYDYMENISKTNAEFPSIFNQLKDPIKALPSITLVTLVNALAFICVLFVIETKVLKRICSIFLNLCARHVLSDDFESNDVKEEARFVDREHKLLQEGFNTDQNGAELLVYKMSKVFNMLFSKSIWAVKGVSFSVRRGECFTLVGLNGAGKSTLFRLLNNEVMATTGDAYTEGTSLLSNPKKYLSKLGYCSQKDILFDFCTGRQILTIFAKIGGVKPEYVQSAVDDIIDALHISAHADKQIETISGGTKRKLCAGVAMISHAPLLLLDEPTTGVDPVAKNRFWRRLAAAKETGQSILLSSHSMDECETVSDRLTIMRSGQLACLGTVESLKEDYFQGFNIELHLKSKNKRKDEIVEFLATTFGNIKQVLDQEKLLRFRLLDKIQWSEIFEALEDVKAKFSDDVKFYTVYETTMEQLFLSFAK